MTYHPTLIYGWWPSSFFGIPAIIFLLTQMCLGLSFLQNKPLSLKYVKFQNVRRYVHFHYIYAFVPSFLLLITVFNGLLLLFQPDYIYWGQSKRKWCLENSQDCSLWNNVSFSLPHVYYHSHCFRFGWFYFVLGKG